MSTTPAPVAKPALSKVHVPALDAIRGLAILLVLLHNLSNFEARGKLIYKLWTLIPECGWIGVELFFVLSGFLITGILLDDKGAPTFFRTFYVRRALRIFPLYFSALLIYVAVHITGLSRASMPANKIILYFLYLSNWSDAWQGALAGLSHMWSLAVEEQFYLVWPLLIGSLSSRTMAITCTAMVALGFVVRWSMHAAAVPDSWLYVTTVARADALVMGALVALALRSPVWWQRLKRFLVRATLATSLATLALLVDTHGFNRLNPRMQVYGYSLLAVLSAALIVAVIANASTSQAPTGRVFSFLRFLGKYSYGIYVVHIPLKTVMIAILGDHLAGPSASWPLLTDWIFMTVVGAMAVGIALASWRWLEKPFLSFKDRLAPR